MREAFAVREEPLRLCKRCDCWKFEVTFERVDLPLLHELCGDCFDDMQRDDDESAFANVHGGACGCRECC